MHWQSPFPPTCHAWKAAASASSSLQACCEPATVAKRPPASAARDPTIHQDPYNLHFLRLHFGAREVLMRVRDHRGRKARISFSHAWAINGRNMDGLGRSLATIISGSEMNSLTLFHIYGLDVVRRHQIERYESAFIFTLSRWTSRQRHFQGFGSRRVGSSLGIFAQSFP